MEAWSPMEDLEKQIEVFKKSLEINDEKEREKFIRDNLFGLPVLLIDILVRESLKRMEKKKSE